MAIREVAVSGCEAAKEEPISVSTPTPMIFFAEMCMRVSPRQSVSNGSYVYFPKRRDRVPGGEKIALIFV